jgi:hypothetical protein
MKYTAACGYRKCRATQCPAPCQQCWCGFCDQHAYLQRMADTTYWCSSFKLRQPACCNMCMHGNCMTGGASDRPCCCGSCRWHAAWCLVGRPAGNPAAWGHTAHEHVCLTAVHAEEVWAVVCDIHKALTPHWRTWLKLPSLFLDLLYVLHDVAPGEVGAGGLPAPTRWWAVALTSQLLAFKSAVGATRGVQRLCWVLLVVRCYASSYDNVQQVVSMLVPNVYGSPASGESKAR